MHVQLFDQTTGQENQGKVGLNELESGIADVNVILYQNDLSANWSFPNPTSKIPTIDVYCGGSLIEADTMCTLTTITVKFNNPTVGYIIIN
jgi:hypothetical protein